MPVDERERRRRRRLVRAHVDAENAHDIEAIVATFSPHATGSLNGDASFGLDAVRQGHTQLGLSHEPGLLSELQVVHVTEHFTDDEIVYEGYFIGKHTGSLPGFPPPTQREVILPYVVLYRFDADDLLVSERARIDFSPLVSEPAPASTP